MRNQQDSSCRTHAFCLPAHVLLACALSLAACGPDVQDPPPERAQRQVKLAEDHLARKSWDDATREVELAEKIAPQSFTVKMAVGRVYAERGWTERAIYKYREAGELNPDKGTASTEIGRCLIAMGRYDEALTELNEAIDQNVALAEPHFLRGFALIYLTRNIEASKEFQECLKKDPNR